MTSLLFSVLAATSLAATGIGAIGDTRSAQSLPSAQLVVAPAHPASTGNLHPVNRLADATPDSPGFYEAEKEKCERHGGHWDEKKMRCHHNPFVYFIGAATVGGFIYAMTSRGGTPSGQEPVSN
jgi:hypothetical protein